MVSYGKLYHKKPSMFRIRNIVACIAIALSLYGSFRYGEWMAIQSYPQGIPVLDLEPRDRNLGEVK